jgi:hypothetical protein
VEPEAAAVVDALSEVETISLGGAVPFMIGVRLEVDTVLRTDESGRAVEPEPVEPKAAAVVDALSEVETIGLGGTGSSGGKKRLEDEKFLNRFRWTSLLRRRWVAVCRREEY